MDYRAEWRPSNSVEFRTGWRSRVLDMSVVYDKHTGTDYFEIMLDPCMTVVVERGHEIFLRLGVSP